MESIRPPHLPKLRLRPGERRRLLVLGDLLMAFLAVLLAASYWARADRWHDFSWEFLTTLPAWFFLMPFLWILLLVEIYDEHRAARWQDTLRGIAGAAVVGLGLYMVLYFTSTPKALPRLGVASFVLAASVLTLIWRLGYIRVFTAPRFMHRVLLVGAGETGKIILKIYQDIWPLPFYLAGIIDDDPQKIGTTIGGLYVFGGCQMLPEVIHKHEITTLVVAISGQMRGEMFQALLDAQEMGVEIVRMPSVYEELLDRVPILYLEADWILRSFVDHAHAGSFYELGKRVMDIVGGLVGFSLMALVYPLIAVSILLESGKPVFYTQVRSGRGGRPYRIIKFRTMRQNAEPNGQPQWAEENDIRTTKVGRFLRKTHLDELPQFINVLRGEMSLVGPRAERPELVDWFQKQIPFYRARLLVKPGITGWAQVNYGYAATVEETTVKLEYDLCYIKRRNLWLDILIMMRTPATVLGLRGR